jgi:hypothetical protein
MVSIAITCQKLPVKQDLKFLNANEVQPDPRWRMHPHFHLRHHELIVVPRGMVLKTVNEEVVARPGDRTSPIKAIPTKISVPVEGSSAASTAIEVGSFKPEMRRLISYAAGQTLGKHSPAKRSPGLAFGPSKGILAWRLPFRPSLIFAKGSIRPR